MKIVDKSTSNEVDFGTIKVGECFKYINAVCIKIDDIIDQDDCRLNAIDLSNGDFFDIEEDSKVLTLKAQIVIESM